MSQVSCCRCAAQFPTFSHNQADGCAATVAEDGIFGHYGSDVADLAHLVFVDPTHSARLPLGGQVCDGCLRVLLESGQIQFADDVPNIPCRQTAADIARRFGYGTKPFIVVDDPAFPAHGLPPFLPQFQTCGIP